MKKTFYFLGFAIIISLNINSQTYNEGKYLMTDYAEKFRANYELKQDFNQRWDSPDNKLSAQWNLSLTFLADIVQAAYYDGVNVSNVANYAKDMIEYFAGKRFSCTPKRQKELEEQAQRLTTFVIEFSKTKRLGDLFTPQTNPANKETNVAEENARREREDAEQRRREETERRAKEEEQRRQAERIKNQMSVYQRNEPQQSSQGIGTDTPVYGSSFPNSTVGIAISFNLSGRSISEGLPQPRCFSKDIQEDGRVVINVTVAPNGNVIQAEIGQGTTIASIITRECALEAAERAKFNRTQGQNNQSGTITYLYRFDSRNTVSSTGNSNQGGNAGFGSFNISGRSIIGSGGLPRPAYTSREEGRIVVNITVDPVGNVIHAEIGRGTTISDPNMRQSALEAAKRAKFNRIQGTSHQTGTITYNYSF